MVWGCMAVSGVGSLIFMDDVTHDGSSRMNSEVYKNILSANLGRLIGRNFITQQDNNRKHTANTTNDLIMEKKWKVLDWPSQSIDLNPTKYVFYLLKRRLKGTPRIKLKLKKIAVRASIKKSKMKNATVW